jgi:hypothetical protein
MHWNCSKKNKDQSCTLPSDDLLNLALMISTYDSAEPKSIDSQDHPSLALLTWWFWYSISFSFSLIMELEF